MNCRSYSCQVRIVEVCYYNGYGKFRATNCTKWTSKENGVKTQQLIDIQNLIPPGSNISRGGISGYTRRPRFLHVAIHL
jgi:deoxycytidylate deaminase